MRRMPNTQPASGPAEAGDARPRSYRHVLERVFDHPWALSGGPTGANPELLHRMAEILGDRMAGQTYDLDVIESRLAAARADQGDRFGGVQVGAVRVIPMYGLITQRASLMSSYSGGTSVDDLRGAVRDALADPEVATIVFDIDSPGGSVDGVPELAEELRRSRGAKPMVGVANTLVASAAYWLAAQLDELVASPSAEVGSIGVYAMHQDLSRAYDAAGITPTLISAGKYKVEANEFAPLDPEARDQLQSQVDAFYRMFVADVAKGRGVSTTVVGDSYGQGRTMLAREAKAAGMVDGIATLEQTVQRFQPRRRGAIGHSAHDLQPGHLALDAFGTFDELHTTTDTVEVVLEAPTPIEPAAPAATKEQRAAFLGRVQLPRKVNK